MKTKDILLAIIIVLIIDYLIAKLNRFPKFEYKGKLPFNYNAQTLPPFGIIVQNGEKGNDLLISHELVHWEQYRKTGAIIYYLKYLFQKIMYGYDEMPMEIEARKRVGENKFCQINYTQCVREGESITVKEQNFRSNV
jgi:hypothetical protein